MNTFKCRLWQTLRHPPPTRKKKRSIDEKDGKYKEDNLGNSEQKLQENLYNTQEGAKSPLFCWLRIKTRGAHSKHLSRWLLGFFQSSPRIGQASDIVYSH